MTGRILVNSQSLILSTEFAALNHRFTLNIITKNYILNPKQLIFIGYFVVGEGEQQHKLWFKHSSVADHSFVRTIIIVASDKKALIQINKLVKWP